MNNKKSTLILTLIVIYIASVLSLLFIPSLAKPVSALHCPLGQTHKTDGSCGSIASPSPTPTPSPSPTPAPSSNNAEEFVFYMDKDQAANIIKDIHGNATISNNLNPLSYTSVYIKNGQFGSTPFQLRYESKQGQTAYYGGSYYCGGSGITSRTKTPDSATEVQIKLSVPLTDAFIKTAASFEGNSVTGNFYVPADNYEKIKSVKACFPDSIKNGEYKAVKVTNFYKLSSQDQSKWGNLQTTAAAHAAETAALNQDDGPDSGSLTDCDAKLTNPLSWILCPLIDLGANLSDSMFRNVISPLLSDVPVSTNSDDPIYKAWQGFRLIANLMLVGSMLMIVYAQTKGGDK